MEPEENVDLEEDHDIQTHEETKKDVEIQGEPEKDTQTRMESEKNDAIRGEDKGKEKQHFPETTSPQVKGVMMDLLKYI